MSTAYATENDVSVAHHGTIAIVTPVTPAAIAWVEENVATDQWWCGGFAVEPRYLNDIISGLTEAGFSITYR